MIMGQEIASRPAEVRLISEPLALASGVAGVAPDLLIDGRNH